MLHALVLPKLLVLSILTDHHWQTKPVLFQARYLSSQIKCVSVDATALVDQAMAQNATLASKVVVLLSLLPSLPHIPLNRLSFCQFWMSVRPLTLIC